MKKLLEHGLKFLDQRNGLPLSKQLLLIAKLAEFAGRRAVSSRFVMKDIWGIRHRYSSVDPMGFKTAVGVYELEEQVFFYNLLASAPVRTIIDVGSAVGTFTSLFARYAPGAKVYSFEPSPFSNRYQAEQLQLNGLADRVQLFPVGLGSTDHTQRFCYTEGLEGSLWGRFAGTDEQGVKEAEVAIRRLDSVEEVAALDVVDLIKIDIEGFELPALLGMEGILTRFKPVILCEHSLSFLVEFEGNRHRETFGFFDKVDYDAFLLQNGQLTPYTWAAGRVMNLILLPRSGGGPAVAAVRDKLVN